MNEKHLSITNKNTQGFAWHHSNMVAIITARGGSKRIPKKNIKEFCGKPIIAYSIEAALDSGMFAGVMVGTDSVHEVRSREQ